MSELVNGAKVEIVSDYDALSQAAARLILDTLANVPKASLLVPTGTSPEGLYGLLVEHSPDTFAGVTFYNLDEYCQETGDGYTLLDPSDTQSYHYYMNNHILDKIPSIQSFFPGTDNIDNPGTYDALIAANGGIDLAINSIGEDGHVFGFNMPGSAFDSVTRLVQLSEDTQRVNQGLTGSSVPTHAISAGMATGMQSRQVVTLLSGERKAEILRKAIWDDINPALPATALRQHPNHLFIVDEAAASKL